MLVFAPSWGTADVGTLESIQRELRGLGAALVVVTEALSFLYDRYDVKPEEVAAGTLHLTLLDEAGHVRMQSSRPAAGAYETTVLDTLRWASNSLASGHGVLFSRREAALLSLVGALAFAAVEGRTPRPSPLPNSFVALPRHVTSLVAVGA